MSDARGTVARFLTALEAALTRGDAAGAAALFGDECYWRDLAALTWNIHTAEGRPAIAAMLSATAAAGPHGFVLDTATDEDGWFSFQTATGRGRGHVRLADGTGFSVLTALQELKGFE